jgi:hypothetical protein
MKKPGNPGFFFALYLGNLQPFSLLSNTGLAREARNRRTPTTTDTAAQIELTRWNLRKRSAVRADRRLRTYEKHILPQSAIL